MLVGPQASFLYPVGCFSTLRNQSNFAMSLQSLGSGGIALMLVIAGIGLAAGFGSAGAATTVAASELGASDDDAVKAGAVAGGATLAAGIVAGGVTGGPAGAIAGAEAGVKGGTLAAA